MSPHDFAGSPMARSLCAILGARLQADRRPFDPDVVVATAEALSPTAVRVTLTAGPRDGRDYLTTYQETAPTVEEAAKAIAGKVLFLFDKILLDAEHHHREACLQGAAYFGIPVAAPCRWCGAYGRGGHR